MILSDYLSRHRQKELNPSELIPISFCCLKAYRCFIDDKIGEDIFCVKARASAKASGDIVGEVHGAEKPLDPNCKPEHQSKSKLPSVTRKPSPIKTIRKPILQTPARLTPKRLATPKSVRIQSDTTNDLPVTEPDPTPMKTPVMVHGGARPKTLRMEGTPLAPSIINPSHSQTQPLIPRRILSSTPSGENGEEIDKRSELIRNIEERRRILEEKRKILEEQNRKIFHPPPVEGIDVGVTEGLETLEPEIRIPTEEDFVLPPPLESLLDKAKMEFSS